MGLFVFVKVVHSKLPVCAPGVLLFHPESFEEPFMHYNRLFALTLTLLLVVSTLVAACAPAAQPSSGGAETGAAAAQAAAGGEEVAISVSGAFALFPLMSVWAEGSRTSTPTFALTCRPAVRARA